MDLIDPRLRTSLSTERATGGPGALTPLAQWINNERSNTGPILKAILEFAGQDAHLEMLNGAGDTPLHALTKKSRVDLMRIILERNPLLVYRENATGRTPAEMAEDNCTAQNFSDPPRIPMGNHYHQKITNKTPESFLDSVDPTSKREKSGAGCYAALALCKEIMENFPGKRRLVSLHEANEVAKRLAAQQARSTKATRNGRASWQDPASADEVDAWYTKALRWNEEGLE